MQLHTYHHSMFYVIVHCTVLPNNREGMTEFFSMESTDNFLINMVQKYILDNIICGISVRFLKYGKIGVNEVEIKGHFFNKNQKICLLKMVNLKCPEISMKYHTFLARVAKALEVYFFQSR